MPQIGMKTTNAYKVVAVPLDTDPPILGGMRLQDLIWPAAAIALDIAVWHQREWPSTMVYVLCTAILGVGFALAGVRVESRSLPQWVGIIAGFIIRPKHYLP